MTGSGSRSPSEEEFADLVHAAWPSLYRTALLLTGDHGLAEDLAQGALATTYSKWHRLRDAGAARAYARRTLVNSSHSWFRRPTNRSERPTGVLPEQVAAGDPGRDAVDRVAVVRALAALPPKQRTVVVLRYYEDLSVEQTAELMRTSTGTVKSQTSAALAKLRTLLGTDLDTDLDTDLHTDLGTGRSTRTTDRSTTSQGGSHA